MDDHSERSQFDEMPERSQSEMPPAAAGRHDLQRYLTGFPQPRILWEVEMAEGEVLVALNLQRFMLVNHWLSHAIGDQLLCGVAQTLQGAAPVGAVMYRGADDFVVRTSGEDATQLEARLRSTVENTGVKTDAGTLFAPVRTASTTAAIGERGQEVLTRLGDMLWDREKTPVDREIDATRCGRCCGRWVIGW